MVSGEAKPFPQAGAAGRATLLPLWGGFLYYLLSGLDKLADTKDVVYRGYPDKPKVEQQYQVGRTLQSSTLQSSTCCNPVPVAIQ